MGEGVRDHGVEAVLPDVETIVGEVLNQEGLGHPLDPPQQLHRLPRTNMPVLIPTILVMGEASIALTLGLLISLCQASRRLFQLLISLFN